MEFGPKFFNADEQLLAVNKFFKKYKNALDEHSHDLSWLKKEKDGLKQLMEENFTIRDATHFQDFSIKRDHQLYQIKILESDVSNSYESIRSAKRDLVNILYCPDIRFPTGIHGNSWVMKTEDRNVNYENE